MQATYRVRAYIGGIGEVCCCSTENFSTGARDLRLVKQKYPGKSFTGIVEIRDSKARSGWKTVATY